MSPMLSSLPPFLRNKMIQLIVTIAKCDWPHDYPDFFDEITMVCNFVFVVLFYCSY